MTKSKVFGLTFAGLLATLAAQSRDPDVARDDFQKGLSLASRIELELATVHIGDAIRFQH